MTGTAAVVKAPLTVEQIVAKPENYGFSFITEIVHKYGRTSGPVPLIKMTNVSKFDENFPGVILETEDGSSIRVAGQRVSRDAYFDSQDHDMKSLQARLVRWLLKIEQPKAKYGPGPKDEYYATPEELKTAWMKFAQK